MEKKVLLYWSDDKQPASVLSVHDTWKRTLPDWEISLFSNKTAVEFLNQHFGRVIGQLFLSCKIPAMQSDFFRVFWALHSGGMYSDLTFVPQENPVFFNPDKSLTLVRWYHGRVVNGLFYAVPDSPQLKKVAFQMIKAVSLRQENNVWIATGPGAWIAALGTEPESDPDVEVTDKAVVFQHHLSHSDYENSTRMSNLHWSKLQEQTPIYNE